MNREGRIGHLLGSRELAAMPTEVVLRGAATHALVALLLGCLPRRGVHGGALLAGCPPHRDLIALPSSSGALLSRAFMVVPVFSDALLIGVLMAMPSSSAALLIVTSLGCSPRLVYSSSWLSWLCPPCRVLSSLGWYSPHRGPSSSWRSWSHPPRLVPSSSVPHCSALLVWCPLHVHRSNEKAKGRSAMPSSHLPALISSVEVSADLSCLITATSESRHVMHVMHEHAPL